MQDEALSLAEEGMEGAVDHLRKSLARVRAGRANPSILDGLRVESYGVQVPLNQVATVSVADARLLVVKPYDRNQIGAIERAINSSQLGLNASNDGIVLRLPIPPLSEERRRSLVKQIKDLAEEAKIACRQSRRDANDLLKEAEKEKEISEDTLKKALDRVQALTDGFVKQIDDLLAKKEAEIMEV
ncbi:MAG: ribosome recycling factor [Myxococcales bacterium]|nr:ribosome recycling factor [Myxococcales bacterium]MCB9568011.1 ribosome recycling factor [Myxococcales bacterium]MCB9700455.1 ribosome recycling factor [Myxococcales bacterium]